MSESLISCLPGEAVERGRGVMSGREVKNAGNVALQVRRLSVGERMKSEEFEAGGWIERLARVLAGLSKTQGPFLKEYCQHNPRHVGVDGRDETPFPLDDLRMLYAQASHGFGKSEYYAPLRAAMDPVRTLLRSHPTLWRAVGPLINNDDFWVQICGHGGLTSLTDLIGGMMAREDELPGHGFHEAAGELHALLDSAGGGDSSDVPGDLDIGYDAVVFNGLCLEEEIGIGGGLAMLPFERARAFVDEEVLKDMAPDVVRFRDWRLVGAVVKPFRWRPVFQQRGDLRDREAEPPGPFVSDALEFLELLAVSHRVPIVCLAVVRECLSRSACRLLGQAHNHGGVQWGRPVHRFDPFAKPPGTRSEAVAEAKTAYGERKSQRYGKLAPIVARLAEALARDGRFAAEDKILDIAIALERMYELGGGEISHKMRTRAAWFLGRNAKDRVQVMNSVAAVYAVRSAIVHNRKKKPSAEKYRVAFDIGFDIAARTLFKLLRHGPPGDWEELVIAGK